jgi:L-amino acid N-acyltransferase YncA
VSACFIRIDTAVMSRKRATDNVQCMRTQSIGPCARLRSVGDPDARKAAAEKNATVAALASQPWLLRVDAATLLIRPGRTRDLPAVAAMHRRCSARTLLDRYRTGGSPPSVVAMDRLLREPLCYVAEADNGTIVAIAVACADSAHAVTSAEVGIVVEDAWQALGIATELMSHLAGAALGAGFSELVAYPGPEDLAAQRLMIGVGRTRLVPDGETPHLHTTLPESASLGLGAVRQRLAG